MKKQFSFLVVFAAGFLFLWQGIALAEMISGQVTIINRENQTLTVERLKETGESEKINLSVPSQAEFRGIKSLNDVEVGDEIMADASKPALGFGAWQANWIEKTPQTQAGQQGGLQTAQTSMGSQTAAKPAVGAQPQAGQTEAQR